MTTDTKPTEPEHRGRKVIYRNGASEAVYGFGLIGALVYYIGHAATFWLGVLGFIKASVWPAMRGDECLNYRQM